MPFDDWNVNAVQTFPYFHCYEFDVRVDSDMSCLPFECHLSQFLGFDIVPPVCLSLSSDDEESIQSDLDSTLTGERLLNNGQRLSAEDMSYTTPDPEVTSSARGKEPVFPEEDDAGSDTGENQQTQGVRGLCVKI